MILAGELPLQIAWFEETVPATLVGFIVTAPETLLVTEGVHAPLTTT